MLYEAEAAEQLRLIRDELKEKYGYGIRILIATGPGHISSDFGTSYQIQTMSHRQIKAACTAVVLQ
ncbi:MAG: hypothetical protein IPN46_19930 [Saprospiraceae bacterium]|nr:hypothetical protein [Saprospiraceae bacterium]